MSTSHGRAGQAFDSFDSPSIENKSRGTESKSFGESMERGDHQIARLKKQLQEEGERQQDLTTKLDERNREIAALIVMLEARDAAVARLLKQEQQASFERNVSTDTDEINSDRMLIVDPIAGDQQHEKSVDNDEAISEAIAAYEQTIIELSKDVDSLQTEVATVRSELLTTRKQVVVLEREKNKAKEELQARFVEIANLTALLERASQEVERLQQERSRPKSEAAARPAEGKTPRRLFPSWGAWGGNRGGARKSKKALMEELALVRASKRFNASWYLETYRDVAQSGMDPAVHYLKFGANEGRDPGPMFSTTAYMREHPEVVNQNINPLVHYVRFGKND